jgi:hypothetical protein
MLANSVRFAKPSLSPPAGRPCCDAPPTRASGYHPAMAGAAQRAFDDLAGQLARKKVVAGKMFGMPILKTGGKAFAGIAGDALVFKLPPDAVQASLRLKGAELFDPGMGRPMKEWVVVPASHATRWPGLADDARAYIATIAAKAKKKPPAQKR